jgi:hypothetical protein
MRYHLNHHHMMVSSAAAAAAVAAAEQFRFSVGYAIPRIIN